MQANARWVALATIITVVAAGTWALASPWIDVHVEAGKVVKYYTHARGYESTWGSPLAGWSWLAALVGTGALGFAMLVGMRRNYLPSVLPAVLVMLGLAAAVGIGLIIHFIGSMPHVVVVYDSTSDFWDHEVTDFKASTSLHVALVCALALAVAAGWLFRVARGVARANAAELAKVDRDIAIRDGDLSPQPALEEDVKL